MPARSPAYDFPTIPSVIPRYITVNRALTRTQRTASRSELSQRNYRRPRRLGRPRTPDFQSGNTGSNPVGDTTSTCLHVGGDEYLACPGLAAHLRPQPDLGVDPRSSVFRLTTAPSRIHCSKASRAVRAGSRGSASAGAGSGFSLPDHASAPIYSVCRS
jgi:hypothetical protein